MNFISQDTFRGIAMNTKQYVTREIKRFDKRHNEDHSKVKVLFVDEFENYTSVGLINGGSTPVIGYAKRNPNCDELNEKTGLSIATFRALRRMK